MQTFIPDADMAKLQQQGQASVPNFIPDAQASQYFGNAAPGNQPSGQGANVYQQNRGILQKIAGFLGMEKAGQGIATTGRELAGHTNQSGNEAGQSLKDTMNIIKALHSLPAGDPRRQHLADYLRATVNDPGFVSQGEIDPGTQLSNKEVAGSFGNVGLNALSGGELTTGVKEGGLLTTRAPQAAESLNNAAKVINKIAAPLNAETKVGRAGNAMIKGATYGAAQGVTQGANDNKSAAGIAKEAGVNSLLGGLLSGGVHAGSELINYLVSPHVTETLYNKAIGISPKTIEAGRSPARTLIDEGQIGTKNSILNDAEKTITTTNQKIQSIVANDGIKHDSQQIVGLIKSQLMNQYGDTLGPEGVDALMQQLPISKLNSSEKLSTAELNSLRQKIDRDFIGNGKWLNVNQDPIKVSAYKTAANVLRGTVQGTNAKLPGLFSREADAITTRNALNKELAKPHALTSLFELLGALGIGAGALIHGGTHEGAIAAASALAAEKAIKSTPARSAAAVGLDRAGKVLENNGPVMQGVKTAGRIIGRQATKQIAGSTSGD